MERLNIRKNTDVIIPIRLYNDEDGGSIAINNSPLLRMSQLRVFLIDEEGNELARYAGKSRIPGKGILSEVKGYKKINVIDESKGIIEITSKREDNTEWPEGSYNIHVVLVLKRKGYHNERFKMYLGEYYGGEIEKKLNEGLL